VLDEAFEEPVLGGVVQSASERPAGA
jgi:hypothetical protein